MLRLWNDHRGNALLEFAVVFPIFIGFILGFINLSLLLHNNIVASSASREAARVTAATASPAAGREAGRRALEAGGLGGEDAGVSVSYVGNKITATTTYRVPVIVPGLGALLGGKPWDREVHLQQTTSTPAEYRPPAPPSPRCGDWYKCR